MWRFFSVVLILLFCYQFTYSKNDTTKFNPYFRDSILKHTKDTTLWFHLTSKIDIHKNGNQKILMQQPKNMLTSQSYLYVCLFIVSMLLILRLLFTDFSFSVLEGIWSIKKFDIFYKSKKFDSFVAVFAVYIFKILLLSFLLFISVHYFKQHSFTTFDTYLYFKITLILFVFFVGINVLEYIFNFTINTTEIYKAFFLQSLFIEFIWAIFMLLLLQILIYNQNLSQNFSILLLSCSFCGFFIFNIIRNFQLLSSFKTDYNLHFFLYICAFKIVPILLLGKFILTIS